MSRDRLWVISVAADPTGVLIPARAPALAVLAAGENAGERCWVNHTTDAARWVPVLAGAAESAAVAALAAQYAAGATNLVSPEAAAAAAALAQTPATVTAAAAASALDALVSIGLNQMATVSIRGFGAAASWGNLRIGGAEATLVSGQQAYGLGSVLVGFPQVVPIAENNAYFESRFVVSSAQEISSGVYYRAVRGYYQSPAANYCGEFSHLIECGAVAADKGIGLGANDNAIGIGTKITVRIDEDALNHGL